ncbi:MAG: endo-1,4-beta-xylanase [Acidobacteriota bacterium]
MRTGTLICLSILLALVTPTLAVDRIVYPQAAVGPIQGQWFEIELHLANLSPNQAWSGTVRLMKQQDLSGMTQLDVTDSSGTIGAQSGSWSVELPANGSETYRIRSGELQVGVLVVQGDTESVSIVPSFFYRLHNQSDDKVTDLIAIQPVREPGLSYDAILTRAADNTFNVGLALVADPALDQAGGTIPTTQVTLTVVLDADRQFEKVIELGGSEAAQRAVFPDQLIEGLPTFDSARLHVAASDPVYLTLLGVGTPPLFEDNQIGAAPAQLAAAPIFPLRSGWAFVPNAQDLVNHCFWGCAGPRITEAPGGILSSAGSGFETRVNSGGTVLQVGGDFGLFVSLDVPAEGESGFLVAQGRAPTGGTWYSGLRRLDLGVVDGQVVARAYDDSPTPTTHTFLNLGSLRGRTTLELARSGGTFTVYAAGAEAGRFPDFNLTEDGRLALGTNVPPGVQMTLFGMAAEEPAASPGQVQAVPSVFRTEVPTRLPSLRAAADARGLFIGAAAAPAYITNEEAYRNTLGGEFNMLTPENEMKWQTIHPERDRYNFCPGDSLVSYAEANGMAVHGHVLVWHQQNPGWLTAGNFSREELQQILKDHIFAVVGHYRGKIREWDVVNEAFNGDGSFRQTLWYDAFQGPEYMDRAFEWAHQADPGAKLFYNDYNTETIGAQSNAAYQYIQGMIARGVPIDGVGFQYHTAPAWAPSAEAVRQNFERFGALGLETNITELDVRLPHTPNPTSPITEAQYQQQAEAYRHALEGCLESGTCKSFVVWGVSDLHSWVPSVFPPYDDALLFDRSYQPKPAYFALLDVLGN